MTNPKQFQVKITDEFEDWFAGLKSAWQDEIDKTIHLLEHFGPAIPRNYSKPIEGSKIKHLCELRVQCQGHPIRILYAFDPTRTAILLLGGDKTGDGRWYVKNIRIAEKLYHEHLASLE